MLYAIFIIGAIICALMAMVAKSLLASTVWLAAISAQIAMLMYLMGAHTIAVIELSVGAGLVTVLFVFAISTAGEETREPGPASKNLATIAVIVAIMVVTVLVWMILPAPESGDATAAAGPTFSEMVWEQRSMDTLLQVVLISAGAMVVLGLISNSRNNQTSHQHLATMEEVSPESSTSINGKPVDEQSSEVSGQADHHRQEELA